MKNDIRWEQRLSSYRKALAQLLKYTEKETLSVMERQGLIKAFEFTYELAWNTLRDYLIYQGIPDIVGSRDTIRYAFRDNLIEDGDGWMEMLQSRNRTSHTYNEETAKEISVEVLEKYIPLFKALDLKMQSIHQ